ncbi:ribonuclease H [Senna tora]|uniref:Ribonuclease H n=1 Tax=Senna tora TaxID=362788 RepID=A0A834WST1_9FABA|nr:ribonuclease H [Senna tora]
MAKENSKTFHVMGDTVIVDRTNLGSEEDHPRPPDKAGNQARNKKYRQDNGSFSGSQTRVPREEEWMQETPKEAEEPKEKMSYRDSLRNPARLLNFDKEIDEGMNGDNEIGSGYSDSQSEEEDEEEPEEEGDGITIEKDVFDRFNLTLSNREWKRLNRPFQKIVDHQASRTGEVELVDLGNNYFLAKFDTFTDREFALTGGPWIILDHYLIIRPWTSLFDPEEQIQKIAAWVHLPDLPIELYDDKFLYTLGSLIGKVLKIDVNTSQQLRGKFARLCVELDLSKPLLSQYYVHGRHRKIEYEGLHLICFECGVYGHDSEHCPVKKARLEKEKQEKEKEQDSGEKIRSNTAEKYSLYGAWMLVVKPRRSRRPRANVLNQVFKKENESNEQGSRFAILGEDDQEIVEKDPEQAPIQDTTEANQKIWTKSKVNPMYDKKEVKQSSKEPEVADSMEVGSPIKQTVHQMRDEPEKAEPQKEADPMVISPSKNLELNLQQSRAVELRPSTKTTPNQKEKPPDHTKKKSPVQKGNSRDFNEIATVTEQKGGSQPNIQKCNNFQNWIDRCNLIDIKPAGPFLTWEGPKRPNQEKLFKRLDRVLCSPAWRTLFQDASVKNVFKLHSYHVPMLVNTEEICLCKSERPFRFEACWTQHKDFKLFLKNTWKKEVDLNNMLDQLRVSLKEWNKNVFGNIMKRKKNLINRLSGIQVAKNKKCSPFLDKLERKLSQELEEVLNQEEVVWFQKARCQWIKDSDRNTKYYHAKAINRRRRNKILMLKKEDGSWTEDLEEIKDIVVSFYKSLFKEDQTIKNFAGIKECWPHIDKIMFSKYKIPSNSIHSIDSKGADSKLWKELCRLWPDFYSNIHWEVGNGSKVRFWKDHWALEGGSFLQNYPSFSNITNIDALTSDFVNDQGRWDMGKIAEIAPMDFVDRISTINPPNPLFGPDQALWKPDKEGCFSISNAYKIVKKLGENERNNHWSAIWSCKIQQRHRFLLWRLSHNRFPTRSRVASWSPASPLCSWCQCSRETNIHALRDCPSVAQIWKAFINPRDRAWFFNISTKDWILWNLNRKKNFCSIPWPSVFAVICDMLWQWRNAREKDINFIMPNNGHRIILHKAKNSAHAFPLDENDVDRFLKKKSTWCKPDRGWIKVNTDGAVCRINKKAGCGGLLRNSDGTWIKGFSANLGLELGFQKVVLESDAKGVVNQITATYLADTNLNPSVLQIKELLMRDWEVKVKHIPRLSNSCADLLAKSSLDDTINLCILDSPPFSLAPVIQLDAGVQVQLVSGG